MRRIEIIPLARKKIERRQVPQEWIEDTLRAPDQIVVVDEEPERFVVITGYLTSQVARYWR